MEDFLKERVKVQRIIRAKEFAAKAHKDQMYGDFPYTKHLNMVATLVEPFGENCQVLAHLHDILEDTDTTQKEISDLFGEYIASCVDMISDCEGKNRKERKRKTYEKLSNISNNDVLIVKTCDRLANVLSCHDNEEYSLLKMYQKEHEEFKKAVYREGLCDDLWNSLDCIIHFPIKIEFKYAEEINGQTKVNLDD